MLLTITSPKLNRTKAYTNCTAHFSILHQGQLIRNITSHLKSSYILNKNCPLIIQYLKILKFISNAITINLHIKL